MNKKYMLTYHDSIEALKLLSDAERGRLFLALLEYSAGDNPILNGNEKYLFSIMKIQINRESEKYEKMCERNKQNRAFGGSGDQIDESSRLGKNTNTNTNTKTNISPPNPLKGERAVESELFTEFWSAYPRKENKPAAVRAYGKIKPMSRAVLDEILSGIERWKKSGRWDEKQYIPHPATFLNGRRWEDSFEDSHAQNESKQSYNLDEYEKNYDIFAELNIDPDAKEEAL